MPKPSQQKHSFTLSVYLEALEQRDFKALEKFYDAGLTFTIGHNSFNRIAVMSLLDTTKDVLQSRFFVHNVTTNGNEINAEITENIYFLRDSDLLFYLAVKKGETVELKTANRYLLKNEKIVTIHRSVISMNKV